MAPRKSAENNMNPSPDTPKIQGGPKNPESIGKVDELRTIIRKFDQDGITIMEGMNIPGAGALIVTTKLFKEKLGGSVISSSSFVPRVEIVTENETGAQVLWEMGTGAIGITRGSAPKPPETKAEEGE